MEIIESPSSGPLDGTMLTMLGDSLKTKEKLELETAFPHTSSGAVPAACAPEVHSIKVALTTCPNWHNVESKQHMDIF